MTQLLPALPRISGPLLLCAALSGAHAAPAIPPSLPGLPGITAQGAPVGTAAPRAAHPCARPAPGAPIAQPEELYSSHGVLNVHLDYYTDVDDNGNSSFCFLSADGSQGPVLHGKPGDVFNISVTNRVPPLYPGQPQDAILTTSPAKAAQCGEATQFAMDPSSMSMHFHGFLVTPACQGDNVTHTVVAAGDTFQYSFPIPVNEPPGLYWYHPHVHGSAEQSVQGGGSGTLIIDGLEQFQPIVAGLPWRVLVLRDQLPGANVPAPSPGGTSPSWDVSVNFVPVLYTSTSTTPAYSAPGVIQMQAGQPELWRVANAAADSILDFQVLYDGVPQPLLVVGLDGVPVNSQDVTTASTRVGGFPVPLLQTTVRMSPGQRTEFVLAPPGPGVHSAVMKTLNASTGALGDTDPPRVLARISTQRGDTGLPRMPGSAGAVWPQRFAGLDNAPVTARRKLYFDEVLQNPDEPDTSPTNFYITPEGQPETLFAPGIAPAITTKVGAVEEWTVENHALEAHVFHIHQIHFRVEAVNGVALPLEQRQLHDDFEIPAWNPPLFSGTVQQNGDEPDAVSNVPYDPATGMLFPNMTPAQQKAYLARYPYPSFTGRFDFRDPITAGDFVYHCHILAHEDQGMMAVIRVLP